MSIAVEARVQVSSGDILGSTGSLGVSRRDPERLYINSGEGLVGLSNIDILELNFLRAIGVAERIGRSRTVLRTPVDDAAAKKLFSGKHPLSGNIEYAVPISKPNSPGERRWLIGLGHNRPERQSQVNLYDMLKDTSPESYTKEPKTVADRVESVVERGYTITNTLTEGMQSQLLDLWKDTFGWDAKEISNLAKRLQAQEKHDPNQKKVWFTGIMEGDKLVAASMAERLDMPLTDDGETLTLVESTEWKSAKENEGLLATSVAVTHAQVLRDLKGLDPLIYAECNYQTRADWAAHGVGMEVPRRIMSDFQIDEEGIPLIPQALMQNVTVNGVMSDFTYWHLSPEGRAKYYSNEDISTALAIIQ